MRIASVILAAGLGTRMRSSLPKVLHLLGGQPLVLYSIAAARQATGSEPLLVLGHAAEAIQQALGGQLRYVLQEPQLGTGHAVQQAEAVLRGACDLLLVTYGDMPLMTAATLRRLVEAQRGHAGPVTMLSVVSPDPRGFGRVLRNAQGEVVAIVEEAQATPEQLAIHELNAGAYCFAADWLWGALPRIPLSPKGENYLTDLVEIAVRDGLTVQAVVSDDLGEMIGINTRQHLAEAEALLRQRINRQWMLAGVTLVDPSSTYIEPGVQIGQDTIIWPNTYLQGNTQIGENCTIGPNSLLRDAQVGKRCQVLASMVEKAVLEDDVDIGPFARLRKGAHLAQGVHMGNFGEVKDSYLGPGTKIGHFSYVGNATIGAEVNIGAGTITCNYDGEKKHPTQIGDGAFIGSDTMLVAPVTVGAGARTGAGAVVTRDLPPNALAVGVPARVVREMEPRD
jgi:bifunctional UDP-N-acetylglucosamine pyrophosphorylase/glucosamine-1-phosphate N-acetyltransferase